MKQVINYTSEWIYISKFNIKPGGIIPFHTLEGNLGAFTKGVILANKGLIIFDSDEQIDNSPEAIKKRLVKIKKGERWNDI